MFLIILLCTIFTKDQYSAYADEDNGDFDIIQIKDTVQEDTLKATELFDNNHFIAIDYGTQSIRIFRAEETESCLSFDSNGDEITFEKDECCEGGWWTIDLSDLSTDNSFLNDMFFLEDILEEYNSSLTYKVLQFYDGHNLIIQVGDENNPYDCYASYKGKYYTGNTFNSDDEYQIDLWLGKDMEPVEANQDIYYTDDGTDPRSSSTSNKYVDSITITKTCVLKAVSNSNGTWGGISTFNCSLKPVMPTVSLKGGTYFGKVSVGLSTSTQGAKIYYTTDGSAPSKESLLYETELTLEEDTELKAVAIKNGVSSDTRTAKYKFSNAIDISFDGEDQGVFSAKQTLNRKEHSAMIIVPYGKTECNVILSLPNGILPSAVKVTCNNQVVNAESTEPYKNKYKMKLASGSSIDEYQLVNGINNTITIATNSNTETYSIACVSAAFDDLPDKVVDYLCVASQYTNNLASSDYGGVGVGAPVTLVGNCNITPCASLGNFGGYITWYYEDGIENDPNNPYGIDFIVIGNSFDGTNEAAEPGSILVSENGETWYTLAGSIHYDDNVIWNQEVKYSSENGLAKYEFTNRESGVSRFPFPQEYYYPLHASLKPEDFTSFTTKGTLLIPGSELNEYGNIRPPYPAFGYADTGLAETCTNETANPYAGMVRDKDYGDRVTTNRDGDGCDIAWAVDDVGNPVKLDKIHYIKVQTASSIDNGAIGEKSTEVCCMRVAKAAESPVGVTTAPSSIEIDGVEYSGENLAAETMINATVSGIFDVKVDASEKANVYINSLRSHTAFMYEAPHDIVRVIVQEGEKEPLIYYFRINQNKQPASKKITMVTFDAGKGLTQDKETLTAFFDEDTVEHFGGAAEFIDADPAKNTQKFLRWQDGDGKTYKAFDANMAKKGGELTLTAKYGTNENIEAAEAVAQLIDALPEASAVKTSDADAINTAVKAYDDLTNAQKDALDPEKAKKLEAVRVALFNAYVAAIPAEVTDDSEAAIKAAQDVYDALPDDLKEQAAAGYIKLVEAKLSVAMDKLAKANIEITEKQKDIEAKQKVIDDKQKDIDDLTKQLNDKIAELKTAKEEEIPALQAEIAELEQKLEKAGSDLADANAEIEELRKELVDNSIKDLIESAEKTIAAIQKDLKEAGDSISTKAIKALVETADQILDAAKTKAEEASAALEANAKEIASLRDQVAKASADLAKAGEELAKAVASGKASEAEITGLKDRLAEAEAAKAEAEKAAQEALAGKQTSDEALEAAQKALKETQDELEKTAAELATLQAKIAASKFKVKGLTVTSKSRKFTVTWTKFDGADGYKVQYRKKGAKKYKNLKELTKNKVVSKKLKKGISYQFRVRTYKMVGEKKVYGKWAKSKAVKCK